MPQCGTISLMFVFINTTASSCHLDKTTGAIPNAVKVQAGVFHLYLNAWLNMVNKLAIKSFHNKKVLVS